MNRNTFRTKALFCLLILFKVVEAQKVILVNVNDFPNKGWEKNQVNAVPAGEVASNVTDLVSIVCRPSATTGFL
jgi:hypothetical protein